MPISTLPSLSPPQLSFHCHLLGGKNLQRKIKMSYTCQKELMDRYKCSKNVQKNATLLVDAGGFSEDHL